MEVEILVAEVGVAAAGADGAEAVGDQLFHILYDGTVMDEQRFSVLGGDAEAITARLKDLDVETLTLGEAITAASKALSGPDRTLAAADLEVAVLSRTNGRRCFRRLADDEVAALLAS